MESQICWSLKAKHVFSNTLVAMSIDKNTRRKLSHLVLDDSFQINYI